MALIEQEALLEKMRINMEAQQDAHCYACADGVGMAVALVASAPTIDALPVVRCRECIFATPFPHKIKPLLCRAGQPRRCSEDDYCNRGRRKEAQQ